MKRVFLLPGLFLACSLIASAQKAESKASGAVSNQSSADARPSGVNLDSGTNLTGQLQNTIDVRQAKVGDQVVVACTS